MCVHCWSSLCLLCVMYAFYFSLIILSLFMHIRMDLNKMTFCLCSNLLSGLKMRHSDKFPALLRLTIFSLVISFLITNARYLLDSVVLWELGTTKPQNIESKRYLIPVFLKLFFQLHSLLMYLWTFSWFYVFHVSQKSKDGHPLLKLILRINNGNGFSVTG